MSWSAKQYTLFEEERTRPVRDLVAAIPGEATRAIDLGCGPGNSTEVLAARFPGAAISGIDSSQDMIDAARARMPQIEWSVADISTWDGTGPHDVILANAALQWVPDHATLMPRLLGKLSEGGGDHLGGSHSFGGSLAVQMPDNLDQPSHRLMRQVAADGPWAEQLAKSAGERTMVGSPAWYYDLLAPHCRRVDIWRTTYYHRLKDGPSGIVEWFKSTGLRPYLLPLDEAMRAAFLARYEREVAKAYPALDDGSVLLPFPRLFIVATR